MSPASPPSPSRARWRLPVSLPVAAAAAAATRRQGSGTTVLNIGMPNGPQTENSNPFLGSSAGASLGYRCMIYEPLVMTNPVKPADPGKPWLATKWTWSNDLPGARAHHPRRREVVRRPADDRPTTSRTRSSCSRSNAGAELQRDRRIGDVAGQRQHGRP